MLRVAQIGQWEESIKQLKLLRGNKEVKFLSDSYPFQTDPDKKGETEKWYAYDFKPKSWKKIRLDAPWESQGYGKPKLTDIME